MFRTNSIFLQASGKVFLTGCQLMARKAPPPSSLVLLWLGWDLDAEGTHKPIYSCSEWGNWDPKGEGYFPNAEAWAFLSLFFYTSSRSSSQSGGKWPHVWSRSLMPEKAQTGPPGLHECANQWLNQYSLEPPAGGVPVKYEQVFSPVVRT